MEGFGMKFDTPFRIGSVVPVLIATLAISSTANAQPANDSAVGVLDQSSLEEPLRSAITTAIRNQPQQRQWGGEHGDYLFGVAVRPLPQGSLRNRATPITLSTVQGIALHEMLIIKAVLQRYSEVGLTDADALRQALLRMTDGIRVNGRVQDTRQEAAVQKEFAVGYVIARRDALTAHLMTDANLSAVKNAYRDVMHARLRALMQKEQWPEAVGIWQHLDERKLESGTLLLDVARCFQKQAEPNKALEVLVRARSLQMETATVEFLTELGDVGLLLGIKNANDFAEESFLEALRRFQNK